MGHFQSGVGNKMKPQGQRNMWTLGLSSLEPCGPGERAQGALPEHAAPLNARLAVFLTCSGIAASKLSSLLDIPLLPVY